MTQIPARLADLLALVEQAHGDGDAVGEREGLHSDRDEGREGAGAAEVDEAEEHLHEGYEEEGVEGDVEGGVDLGPGGRLSVSESLLGGVCVIFVPGDELEDTLAQLPLRICHAARNQHTQSLAPGIALSLAIAHVHLEAAFVIEILHPSVITKIKNINPNPPPGDPITT